LRQSRFKGNATPSLSISRARKCAPPEAYIETTHRGSCPKKPSTRVRIGFCAEPPAPRRQRNAPETHSLPGHEPAAIIYNMTVPQCGSSQTLWFIDAFLGDHRIRAQAGVDHNDAVD
jgi:hypothetical protein